MSAYGDNRGNGGSGGVRLIYGIFMILVYLIVGLLFIFDVFQIHNTAISCTVGGLLIAYGIWRGVRLFIGSR